MTQKDIVKSTCKHCGLPIEKHNMRWFHGGDWEFCSNATRNRVKYSKETAEPFDFNDYLKEVEL